jgi:hypothetical protein
MGTHLLNHKLDCTTSKTGDSHFENMVAPIILSSAALAGMSRYDLIRPRRKHQNFYRISSKINGQTNVFCLRSKFIKEIPKLCKNNSKTSILKESRNASGMKISFVPATRLSSRWRGGGVNSVLNCRAKQRVEHRNPTSSISQQFLQPWMLGIHSTILLR